MEPPLGSSNGDSERPRDLDDRPPLDVVENQDHPVLRPKAVERAADRVVVDHFVHLRSGMEVLPRFRRGAFRARVGRPDRHLAKPDPVSARHQGGVRDDPIEPAVEDRRIAKAGELPPR
jgi:hypothetical protein